MSIIKVEVVNRQGNLLTLPLDDIAGGFIVKEIQGLDPVQATLVSSNFATLDGEEYQSSSLEKRNIHIILEYNPDYTLDQTVRGLRKQLYPYFRPKSPITLKVYMTDGLIVQIDGRVETMEAPLFTATPTVDVSIVCFKPDFINPTPVVITGLSTSDATPTSFDVDGSEDTGIELTLTVTRATMSEFTVYHTPPGGSVVTLQVTAALVLDDVVRIDTRPGSKAATLTRASNTTSLLYAVSPQSIWTTLENGTNQIRVYTTGTGCPATVQYYNRYGGL
jgi:hypothetical protein